MGMVMDQESIVYGCIKYFPAGNEQLYKHHYQHNCNVLKALPGSEGWPLISKDMFTLPDVVSMYDETQVIALGASYRGIEYEWEQWISSFEALLKKMYWVDATVHLETELSGQHRFSWEAGASCHEPSASPLSVRCEWEHEPAIQRTSY